MSGLDAFVAIVSDPSVTEITFRTLRVSGLATFLALVVGVPAGAWVALRAFPGRRAVVALLYTGMGFPPVAVGLAVLMLLGRDGLLGGLGWLYTESAMVLAQWIIAVPVVAGLTYSAVAAVPSRYRTTALALGVSPFQADLVVLREARIGLWVAGMAAFGLVISEVGAVMMVGGNIAGETRVLTTAIIQEARLGRFGLALALAVVLVTLSFAVHYGLTLLHEEEKRR